MRFYLLVGCILINTFVTNANAVDYVITQTSGVSIVSGTTDIGTNGDDVVKTISLPFAYTFYGQSYTNVRLSSNGNIQFASNSAAFLNQCIPDSPGQALTVGSSILAFWDDLRTDRGIGSGIFTNVSGAAFNRIFNIEWRAVYHDNTNSTLNFEVRLYEGQQRFDIIFGILHGSGSSATVGTQYDLTHYTYFDCNVGGLSNAMQLTFVPSCVGDGCDTNGAALRIVSIALSGVDVLIDHTCVSNQTYELQFMPDLATTNWAGRATNTATVTGTSQFTDSGGANQPQRFYRVRLLP